MTFAAENALLGAIVANPHLLSEVRRIVTASAFSDTANINLWTLLCNMDDAGEEISLESVYPKTNAKHFTQNITPALFSRTLTEMLAAANNLTAAAAKRRTYFTAIDLLQKTAGEATPGEIIATLGELTRDLQQQVPGSSTKAIADVITEFGEVLEKRQKDVKAGRALRVPTSFPQLDWLTYGGFCTGNLVILAARPSVGKTAIMLQMARAAASSNIPALIFSLEMTNTELAQRMAVSTGYMNSYDIARGAIDWTMFEKATGKFADAPLWLNDNTFTLDDICTEIHRASRAGKCGIAYIDYLGLISFTDGGKSLYQQVTDATKRLKRLAKECDIPVVLLCQLNRDMSKEGRAPQLHDLRDSGSIEQDADIVLMLQRDLTLTAPDQPNRRAQMFVRKNRQGRVGDCITLEADTTFTNFTEIPTQQ